MNKKREGLEKKVESKYDLVKVERHRRVLNREHFMNRFWLGGVLGMGFATAEYLQYKMASEVATGLEPVIGEALSTGLRYAVPILGALYLLPLCKDAASAYKEMYSVLPADDLAKQVKEHNEVLDERSR